MSQYNTQTSLSLNIQRSLRSMASEFTRILSTSFEVHCASSPGGPGLNFGDDRGVNSTLGTTKPYSGCSALGVANSYKVRN